MDKEKDYNTSAGGASEDPENGMPEQRNIYAGGVNGGAANDEDETLSYYGDMNEVDLSGCSDEELDEIISGRMTLEDYLARQDENTVYFQHAQPELSYAEPEPETEAIKPVKKKSGKKIVFPILAVLCVCVIAAVVMILLNEGGETPVFNAEEYAVAYAKNSTMHIASYMSKGVLAGNEESAIKFSKDRKVAAFSQVHESNRNKDDLYFCDVRNEEEVSSGGVKVDSSVMEFHITPDGKHIIYTKALEKQTDAYCYSIKDRSAVKLDAGIHDFYIPQDRSDYFFYVKSNGASNTVYRYDIGDNKSENVLKGAGDIKFISDENGSFLFVELRSEKDGFIDLYTVEREGEAQKILSEVLSVMYDRFLPGGSLYFMRTGESVEVGKSGSYDLESVITDDKAEADAAMTEPSKEDYYLGSFLGIRSYDLISYAAAQSDYKKKQERDEIRQAIEKGIEKDAVSRGKCSCCAYDLEKKTETVVCEGVSEDGIVAVNQKGAPRVIFTKYRLVTNEQTEPITIDEAVAASKKFQGSLEDYLKSLFTETAVPDGLALSLNLNGKVDEEEIKDYSVDTASFFFADSGNKLIALVKDEEGMKNSLVSMVISDAGIGVVNPIDNNVTEIAPAEKGYYYLRVESGRDKGDLLYYPDSGTSGELLLPVVEKLMLCEDGSVLAVHKPNGAIPSLSLCRNGAVTVIDSDVNLEQIAYYSEDCIAYIKNSEVGPGDLYLFNGKTAPVLIDSGVSKIFTDQP